MAMWFGQSLSGLPFRLRWRGLRCRCSTRPNCWKGRTAKNTLSLCDQYMEWGGPWERLSTRGTIWNKRRGKTPMQMRCVKCKVRKRNAEYDVSLCPSPTFFLSLLILSARSPARHGTPFFFSFFGALLLSSASFSAPMIPPPQYSGCVGWEVVYYVVSVAWMRRFLPVYILHKYYGDDPSSEKSSINCDTSSFLSFIVSAVFFCSASFFASTLASKQLHFFAETPWCCTKLKGSMAIGWLCSGWVITSRQVSSLVFFKRSSR